ncbi:MAG: type II toxin-antitoxin system Phd/YefM family antitoxin [Dehalococcoidia bacterium]
MRAVSFRYAQENLETTLDRVRDDCEPVIITREGDDAYIVLTLQEYNRLEETAHLQRSPANAAHLQRARTQTERGEARERAIDLG